MHGKIFASLFPSDGWSVIELTPEFQVELIGVDPGVFEACDSAWGRNGATKVFLADAEEGNTLRALISAWRKHAPKSLIGDGDEYPVKLVVFYDFLPFVE